MPSSGLHSLAASERPRPHCSPSASSLSRSVVWIRRSRSQWNRVKLRPVFKRCRGIYASGELQRPIFKPVKASSSKQPTSKECLHSCMVCRRAYSGCLDKKTARHGCSLSTDLMQQRRRQPSQHPQHTLACPSPQGPSCEPALCRPWTPLNSHPGRGVGSVFLHQTSFISFLAARFRLPPPAQRLRSTLHLDPWHIQLTSDYAVPEEYD